MGVSGLGKWLRTRYPSAFLNSDQIHAGHSVKRHTAHHGLAFDEVYVDLNGILHTATRNCVSESQVFRFVDRMLRSLISKHTPTKRLYLAMDGPASLAKLALQRMRRESIAQSVYFGTRGFDAQHLTPGCTFMTRAEEMLQKAIEQMFAKRQLPPSASVIISGASTAGEGELKIVRELQRSLSFPHSRLVISGDSDLFVHSLCLGAKAKLNGEVYVTFDMGRSAHHAEQDWFVASKAQTLLAAEVPLVNAKQACMDYALLCYFAGSDYLPPAPFCSFRTLWNYYCRWAKSPDFSPLTVIETGRINPRSLQKLANYFIENEDESAAKNGLSLLLKKQVALSPQQISSYLIMIELMLRESATGQAAFAAIYNGPSPTILDFQTMDCDRIVQSKRDLYPSVEPLPGASALLMLPSKEGPSYYPNALDGIAEQAKNLQTLPIVERYSAVSRLIHESTILSSQDRRTIFARNPVLFERGRWSEFSK